MKITQITYSKQLKLGLPNYSNVTIGMNMTVDYNENESLNHGKMWDIINQELQNQSSLDPSWIKQESLKESTKYTVKIPFSKGGDL